MASLTCSGCDLQYCSSCTDHIHKKGKLKNHQIQGLMEVNNDDNDITHCVTTTDPTLLSSIPPNDVKCSTDDSNKTTPTSMPIGAIAEPQPDDMHESPSCSSHASAHAILEKAYLQEKLNREHFHLLESGGHVRCYPRQADIALGKAYKALSNLHDHVKTPKHKMGVTRFNDKKLRDSIRDQQSEPTSKKVKIDEQENIAKKMAMNKAYNEIEICHGKITFQLIEARQEIMCRFCLSKFKVFPEAGSLLNNVKSHVASSMHKSKMNATKPQTMISSFFKRNA